MSEGGRRERGRKGGRGSEVCKGLRGGGRGARRGGWHEGGGGGG